MATRQFWGGLAKLILNGAFLRGEGFWVVWVLNLAHLPSAHKKSWHSAIPFQNPPVTAPPFGRRAIVACMFLVIITLAVYWPVHAFKFVAYDDNNYVYQNSTVLAGLTWNGVGWAFVDRQANNWHPLTWISHMLDAEIFGLHAGGPHMVNVAFHCANAVLLFLLLHTLMRLNPGASTPNDFFWRNLFVAGLFALHPMRVESVAWISERKDVLSGFFGLLSLLCYAKYATGSAKPRASLPYRLALVFFVCSLLAKPTLVTLPLVMLLLDYWPLRRLRIANVKEKWPFFLLSVIFCVVTLLAQQPGLPGQHLGTGERIENIAVNYLGYIEKLLWPQDLSFLYMRPAVIPLGQFLVAMVVLLGISLAAWMSRKRCPAFLVGWLWFLIVLFPMCGIVALGWLSIADRYTYLSSIGFYLMLTWWLADLKPFSSRAGKILLGSAGVIILAVCAVLSSRQLSYWQNSQTLFEHALKVDPNNSVAQQNLHIYLFEKENPKVRAPVPE